MNFFFLNFSAFSSYLSAWVGSSELYYISSGEEFRGVSFIENVFVESDHHILSSPRSSLQSTRATCEDGQEETVSHSTLL